MKIMVFDVPAEVGGTLAILKNYYDEAVRENNPQKEWYFVVSVPELPETETVKVLRFPWIKTSWLHRLFFDTFVARRLVVKHGVDEILSLQNVAIPRVSIRQSLYVHQAFPFVDQRLKFKESPRLWLHQNVIGKKILRSIKRADRVIVQTHWMKDACVSRTKVPPEKIVVIPPVINVEVKRYFEPTAENFRTFFYPASGFIYKNHKIILDAALLLKGRGIADYRILFTLRGDENRHIAGLCAAARQNDLPITFVGPVARERILDYYGRSVLIFPSCIEAYGLPLLEARLHQAPVLASDMPFSHEILDGYEKTSFFGVNDAAGLADLLEECLETSRGK